MSTSSGARQLKRHRQHACGFSRAVAVNVFAPWRLTCCVRVADALCPPAGPGWRSLTSAVHPRLTRCGRRSTCRLALPPCGPAARAFPAPRSPSSSEGTTRCTGSRCLHVLSRSAGLCTTWSSSRGATRRRRRCGAGRQARRVCGACCRAAVPGAVLRTDRSPPCGSLHGRGHHAPRHTRSCAVGCGFTGPTFAASRPRAVHVGSCADALALRT